MPNPGLVYIVTVDDLLYGENLACSLNQYLKVNCTTHGGWGGIHVWDGIMTNGLLVYNRCTIESDKACDER